MAEESSLPKTTTAKFLKEIVPSEVRLGADCKDIAVECCNELIHLLTSEAATICEETKKKTITGAEIVLAVQRLGLADYLAAAQAAEEEFKSQSEQDKERRKKEKMKTANMTPEELERQQEEIFRQAREAMQAQQLPEASTETPKQQGFTVDTSLFDE